MLLQHQTPNPVNLLIFNFHLPWIEPSYLRYLPKIRQCGSVSSPRLALNPSTNIGDRVQP